MDSPQKNRVAPSLSLLQDLWCSHLRRRKREWVLRRGHRRAGRYRAGCRPTRQDAEVQRRPSRRPEARAGRHAPVVNFVTRAYEERIEQVCRRLLCAAWTVRDCRPMQHSHMLTVVAVCIWPSRNARWPAASDRSATLTSQSGSKVMCPMRCRRSALGGENRQSTHQRHSPA